MGNFYSNEDEDDQNKKEEKEQEKKENSKSHNEPLRTLSNKFPIKETKPMILADNIYYNQKSNLGKKRIRTENSDEQNKEDENKTGIKKQKIEENQINKLENIDDKKNSFEIKQEQNIKLEFHKQKSFNKLKIEPSSNVKYSNISSLSFHNKFDNKMNIIDNSINFSFDKIYDNKNMSGEKNKKEKYEKNSLNSFMIPSVDKNIKKQEKINDKLEENIEKNLLNKEEETYSFECPNKNLYVKGMKGIDQLYVDLTIRNNGKLDWPKGNIFLKNDKEKSLILADEIKIISLKTGWITEERIFFKYLKNILPGIYYSYINLNINGKNYGEPIKIKVEILENEEEKKINNLINKMRKDYQLPEKEVSDEELKKVLIKNNFDISGAFESLYGED